MVADGTTTAPPSSITYSSIVSIEIFRIVFSLASSKYYEIYACDIRNSYLNAKCHEKLCTEAGPEFGIEKGTMIIIARALYGLNRYGTA